ncbi:transposase, partial [Neobacillus mesonae]|uniref:transposase n=1 Tax=Neobacillus mesonae TaxID=1193713 RepID=UPI00203E006B
MVKFSSEFREKVVLDYLTGGGGSKLLAKKYSIGSHKTILKWVNQYKKYGDNAFNVRNNKDVYNGNFKLGVLEWMKSNKASLAETALHFNISTESTIWTWERKFEEQGVEALFKRRGRPKQMTAKNKSNKKKVEES